MSDADVRRAIDAVWRIESARLIAGLTRIVRDVGLAEQLAHDALVAALEQWPAAGIPANPGAWLMAAGRNRAIDHLRRARRLERSHAEIGREREAAARDDAAELDAAIDNDLGDDVLRLIFMTCHPVLPTEARVALTLRLLGGLTTDEIARAYLTTEPAIAQRIVRAKRTLSEKQIPFEVPRGRDRADRLASVLEVIYLVFNEGYTATAGDNWTRPALCEDALRLARVLAGLAPDEPEVLGLAALLELQSSRLRARIGPSGEPILLLDQNRALWDPLLIRRGLAALDRGLATLDPGLATFDLGLTTPDRGLATFDPGLATPDRARRATARPGPYLLQAAIAACHARARTAAETDWPRIAALYAALAAAAPSPIVELNRAVAESMAAGPQAGLDIVDRLVHEPALAGYHLLPSVRGDLLFKLGRLAEARAEFLRAAALTRNAREQTLLQSRARACDV